MKNNLIQIGQFYRLNSRKNKRRKQAIKSKQRKTSDIADYIGLSTARTREIIAEMDDVTGAGGNSNKTYHLI